MRIGICDDNEIDLNNMLTICQRVAPDHIVNTYSESGKLLKAISEGASFDLLFLDIIMPDLSGMELAREIEKAVPGTPVVFLTDSDAYAVEAFSVNALHYIIKSMTESALKECLRRLEEKQSLRKRVYIFGSAGIRHMVFEDEILYAQSDAHYFFVHLVDGSVIKARMTQSEIQDTLGRMFLPISRGLIVHVDFIRQLKPKSCILKDGREILLSRKSLDEIHAAYASYVFSQLSQRDNHIGQTRQPTEKSVAKK